MRVYDSMLTELTAYKTALIRAKMEEYYNITHSGVNLPRFLDTEYKEFNKFVNERIEQLKDDPIFNKMAIDCL